MTSALHSRSTVNGSAGKCADVSSLGNHSSLFSNISELKLFSFAVIEEGGGCDSLHAARDLWGTQGERSDEVAEAENIPGRRAKTPARSQIRAQLGGSGPHDMIMNIVISLSQTERRAPYDARNYDMDDYRRRPDATFSTSTSFVAANRLQYWS